MEACLLMWSVIMVQLMDVHGDYTADVGTTIERPAVEEEVAAEETEE